MYLHSLSTENESYFLKLFNFDLFHYSVCKNKLLLTTLIFRQKVPSCHCIPDRYPIKHPILFLMATVSQSRHNGQSRPSTAEIPRNKVSLSQIRKQYHRQVSGIVQPQIIEDILLKSKTSTIESSASFVEVLSQATWDRWCARAQLLPQKRRLRKILIDFFLYFDDSSLGISRQSNGSPRRNTWSRVFSGKISYFSQLVADRSINLKMFSLSFINPRNRK